MAAERGSPRVAIAGASTLLGKELKQLLEDRNFPASDIVLLDESVMAGVLTEVGGEATFVRPLEQDSFEGARLVFFTGTPTDAARNWPAAQRAGAHVIDLSGAVSGEVSAIRTIPSLNAVFPPSQSRGANGALGASLYVAEPAPVLIACTLAAALKNLAPLRVALTLYAPVSERDQPGIEELETQTASLLSFREISKTVFDIQVAFSMLSAYGRESKPPLADRRASIARETSAVLAGRAVTPAIQLLHAPVFYGYAFSAYAEFAQAVASAQIESALSGVGVRIAAADDLPPSNVSVAGESEIYLAPIETDPNVPSGAWLWGAADNLRLAAANAMRIAEDLVREP
jgi:aspartate-semialdehyde dehydrogenase